MRKFSVSAQELWIDFEYFFTTEIENLEFIVST